MIERKIIIGLITSTEFFKAVRSIWKTDLLESSMASMLAKWCVEYYDEFRKAPGIDIETIYYQKLKEGLDNDIAEEIEQDILPELSDEYEQESFDIPYMIVQTKRYFETRKLQQLSDDIDSLVKGNGNEQNRIEEAQELINEYKTIKANAHDSIDLSDESTLKDVEEAFKQASDPVIYFPKELGLFWNSQMVPGSFISFLAPEKRGKTFWLLELTMRASRQGKKIAFFQAGDMNKATQLKRIATYLTKRSHLEKYCGSHYVSVRDCIRNQMDKCDKKERECNFGIFPDLNYKEINALTSENLLEAFNDYLDYKPCFNCSDYITKKLGAPWLKKHKKVNPLEKRDAVKVIKEFFQTHKRRFKLSTHPNGTLSVDIVESILDEWEQEDGFVPDIIAIDYADIMAPSIGGEFRHQQNRIWQDLRRLSQTPRNNILPLVIAPTQADSASYKVFRLSLENFTEDKRKFGHVTAMYGLNQSPDGREKGLGITRINEIVIRDGEFLNTNEVTVLQNLRHGRPFVGCYF